MGSACNLLSWMIVSPTHPPLTTLITFLPARQTPPTSNQSSLAVLALPSFILPEIAIEPHYKASIAIISNIIHSYSQVPSLPLPERVASRPKRPTIMVSDETYEICLPVLEDSTIEDEDKTDKLEELLRKETALTGQSLENAVLDVLWRYREGGGNASSPPAIRQTILRRPSPASFRSSATPLSGSPRLGVSPLAPPGFAPTFNRTLSSAASPFTSPRPSPRLAFATPAIPHSPNLNAYEFANDTEPSQEIFEDYTSDNVDWLVADDAVSVASSLGASSGLNAAAPEFSSQQALMRPHDVLRSILGESRTDDEISQALVAHGYDLGAVLISMMDNPDSSGSSLTTEGNGYLVGKSMTPDARPTTPADQKSGVICKFFLSSGSCMRADCRFSHDLSSHLCR